LRNFGDVAHTRVYELDTSHELQPGSAQSTVAGGTPHRRDCGRPNARRSCRAREHFGKTPAARRRTRRLEPRNICGEQRPQFRGYEASVRIVLSSAERDARKLATPLCDIGPPKSPPGQLCRRCTARVAKRHASGATGIGHALASPGRRDPADFETQRRADVRRASNYGGTRAHTPKLPRARRVLASLGAALGLRFGGGDSYSRECFGVSHPRGKFGIRVLVIHIHLRLIFALLKGFLGGNGLGLEQQQQQHITTHGHSDSNVGTVRVRIPVGRVLTFPRRESPLHRRHSLSTDSLSSQHLLH